MNTALTRKVVVAAAIAAALAGAGLPSAIGASRDTGTPAWFAPIAEWYGHNPAITPETDFAELLFGGLAPRVPDWFAPIAASYGHNPAITPETDFAELLFGGLTN